MREREVRDESAAEGAPRPEPAPRPPRALVLAVALAALAVLLPSALVHESLRYPRIARSGFWWHPDLLARALVRRHFPGPGVPAGRD